MTAETVEVMEIHLYYGDGQMDYIHSSKSSNCIAKTGGSVLWKLLSQ